MPNLEALPDFCYGVHLVDNALIILKKGETGFWPTEGYTTNEMFPTFDDVADLLNTKLGVTKAQRAAMEAGSMFGFDIPGADPARYDENGRSI